MLLLKKCRTVHFAGEKEWIENVVWTDLIGNVFGTQKGKHLENGNYIFNLPLSFIEAVKLPTLKGGVLTFGSASRRGAIRSTVLKKTFI
jgi:hypothetical protein